MPLRIDILTLFPEMFPPILGTSIPKRAAEKGLVEYYLTNIRDFATDAHKSVDDKPFGGGPGMVMMAPVMFDSVEHVEKLDARQATRILLTPQGRQLNQELASEFAKKDRLLLIAGHYEGFDERISSGLVPIEVSIGDYVLSGGELGAAVIVEAVMRLLPGAVGNEASTRQESFSAHVDSEAPGVADSTCGSGGLLDYPHYTRPADFRGMAVPEVLLNGDHQEIRKWRRQRALEKTLRNRPDLLEGAALSDEDAKILARIKAGRE